MSTQTSRFPRGRQDRNTCSGPGARRSSSSTRGRCCPRVDTWRYCTGPHGASSKENPEDSSLARPLGSMMRKTLLSVSSQRM
ncbi:hypothetical protein EYF80_062993 [Liparis tanakae]|uniref:Uncharacterized protein n=1 Tax=Liparis tanakae TaxID=230148 RepID=A0A4Z2EEE4_9TELE|nr:hypothetical protein EYF80_062993 [Liparis tanakae]